MTEPPDASENKILGILKSIALRVGLQILILFAVTVVGWVNAANNAVQASKDESTNRRISGVEAAISDLPDLREQVSLLNQSAERGRADRVAFQDRTEVKLDAMQTTLSQLASVISAQTATINMLLRGTPGPPPTSLRGP